MSNQGRRAVTAHLFVLLFVFAFVIVLFVVVSTAAARLAPGVQRLACPVDPADVLRASAVPECGVVGVGVGTPDALRAA